MHVNFKYVVLTIGSIFLALGIGILIGSNLGTNEAVQKQNQAIVKDINKQVLDIKSKDEDLTKENKKLKDVVEKYNGYIVENSSVLTANKLLNKTVGLLSFDSSNIDNEIQNTITNVGGKIGFVIKVNNSIFDKDNYNKISDKLNINIKKEDDIVNLIMNSIKDPKQQNVLTTLASMGFINKNNINSQYGDINSIVVINGQNNKISSDKENPYVELVNDIKGDKQVVVVQTQSVSDDVIKPFMDMKLPTINNIEQQPGKISLINCLANDKLIGNYGINKDNDDSFTTMALSN